MQTFTVGRCLMECGPIAAGLSFNGYDKESGEARHDRVQSAIIWNLETSYRIKDFLTSWNISVHEWLKNYIFLRMLPSGKSGKTGSSGIAATMTFLVSAVWHGFYPGYFSFFLSAAAVDYVAKVYAPLLSPLFRGWCPWPV